MSYGAAEFSRDVDFAILTSPANLGALGNALRALAAEVIAVPPFEVKYLRKGHAVHFRCHDPQAEGLRVDVMSRMRGVASFETLWRRRTTVELPDGNTFDLLSLADLVRAKKTQRDKDWPMIRRLLEADFFQRRENAMPADTARSAGQTAPALRRSFCTIKCASTRDLLARSRYQKSRSSEAISIVGHSISRRFPSIERFACTANCRGQFTPRNRHRVAVAVILRDLFA